MRSNRSNSHHAKFARAEEHDEKSREDPPRRNWLRRLTVLALIAIRTYAYRTYYVKPASTQTPAVVTAVETPTQVIPVISEPSSGKLIQDRVGALGPGERRVLREEQPVEPRSSSSMPSWALFLPPGQPP